MRGRQENIDRRENRREGPMLRMPRAEKVRRRVMGHGSERGLPDLRSLLGHGRARQVVGGGGIFIQCGMGAIEWF